MQQRSRLASRAILLAVLTLPSVAAALSAPLYLRQGPLLSPTAPSASEPRDDIRADVRAGQQALLGEFTTATLGEPLVAPAAIATLYLVSGQTGMEGCASVTAQLVRLQPPAGRAVIASGSVSASILPRRE